MKHLIFNKLKYLLVLCLMLAGRLYGQSQPDIQLPKKITPEAAAIMKYVDYPVSLCYGLPEISIPLYELTEGEIKLPISLSYHASGLKVNEENGRVGQGWSLNLEPSVSRKVNGLPDERGYLVAFGWTNLSHPDCFYNHEMLADGTSSQDEDPDAFYYQLAGKSGKFYFKRGGTLQVPTSSIEVITIPFEPIKVEYDKNLSFFNVTDDNGYFYRFGRSLSGKANSFAWADTSVCQWKATEMISPNKRDTISFSYSPSDYSRATDWSATDYIAIENYHAVHNKGLTPDARETTGCPNAQWPFITQSNSSRSTSSNNITMTKDQKLGIYKGTIPNTFICDFNDYPVGGGSSTLKEKTLQVIETRNVRMEITEKIFAGQKEIDKITVKYKKDGGQYELVRTIQFYVSNYNNRSFSYKRKLDSLCILDANHVAVEKYKFKYHRPDSVPDLLDKNSDHWGYYNGTHLSKTDCAVPRMDFWSRYDGSPYTLSIGKAVKTPSEQYTKYGVLESITYPTGRKSIFSYESNKYKDYLTPSPVQFTGGLRVSKITECDPITLDTLARVFTYGENEDGMGMLRYKITLDDYIQKKLICYRISPGFSGTVDSLSIIGSQPMTEAGFSGGSPVYYEHAVERRVNVGSPQIPLGRTVYQFIRSTVQDIERVPGTSMVFNMDWNTWAVGHLIKKSEEEYLTASSKYRPVKTQMFTYGTYKTAYYDFGKTYRVMHFKFCDPNDSKWKDYNLHTFNGLNRQIRPRYSGCMKLTSEMTDTYVNGVLSLSQERTYSYENLNHMYPTTIKDTNSDGTVTTIRNKYPQDMSYSDTSEESARTALVTQNRLSPLLEQTITTSGDARSWIDRLSFRKETGSDISQPYRLCKGYSTDIQERLVIQKYDSYGNPAQISQDGIQTVFLWGYKGKYLMAEIKNLTYAQVEKALGGADVLKRLANSQGEYAPNRATLNAISPTVEVTTYKYKPLVGVTEVTDPRGVTTYYNYDSAGRLKETSFMDGNRKRVIEAYDYRLKN